jgi:hypothetical protein
MMLIAVPVGVWVADTIAERIEVRRGSSSLTRTLRIPGRWRRRESLLADPIPVAPESAGEG